MAASSSRLRTTTSTSRPNVRVITASTSRAMASPSRSESSTTLPLCSRVRTPENPASVRAARRGAIGTRLCAPTLTPRRRATWRAIAAEPYARPGRAARRRRPGAPPPARGRVGDAAAAELRRGRARGAQRAGRQAGLASPGARERAGLAVVEQHRGRSVAVLVEQLEPERPGAVVCRVACEVVALVVLLTG